MLSGAIRATSEFHRILSLPRRNPTPEELDELARELTELLKTPDGEQTLRRVQALALHDIGLYGGAYCPVGTGEGKTLISLLAAYVLNARRPLLILPAGLLEKTRRAISRLRQHWLVPTNIRLFSCELLGRVQAAEELNAHNPDLVLIDEAQRFKDPEAARTRRLDRFEASHPDTRFVCLSGTPLDKSLLECGHIIRWCLKDKAPVPLNDNELTEWALALDENTDEFRRPDPGPLVDLAPTPEHCESELQRARLAFQRRLAETPGVIATIGKTNESATCPIYIRGIRYKMRPITEQHVARLHAKGKTPDDWDVEPLDIWRHSRELAVGYHGVWIPRPPDEWRDARREWFAYVRGVLSRSKTLDSPEHVEQAIEGGLLPAGREVLDTWRRIKPTFTPNPVPVWHDDSALKVAAEWMTRPGLVWTEHVPFALRLSEMTGAPYFGAKALDANGQHIYDTKAEAVIVSIDANREGLDLQEKWSRNLFVSPHESPGKWQQAIARTHRPKHCADCVEVDIFLGCIQHYESMRRALSAAEAVRDTTGAEQKLLLAQFLDWPTEDEVERFAGPLWHPPPPDKFEIPIPVAA